MTEETGGERALSLWPPSFDAAIFDFDGTLADSMGIWEEVDRRFLASRNIPYTDDLAREIPALGFELGAAYVIEKFGLDETVGEICAEWTRLGSELYRARARLRPGAEQYVRALLASGVPCAIATTNDPEVLGSLKGRLTLDELFCVQVHGCDVARSKEHPDIYLLAAERLGAAPERCCVFEDLAAGIRAARGVGMATCGIDAHASTQQLDRVRSAADAFIDDWTDIPL